MNYPETLVDHDGDLCVLYRYTLTDTPELARSFYPIGCKTRHFVSNYGDGKIGQTLRTLGDGIYQDNDGLKYRLVECGRTKPIAFDRVPVPCPKVRKGIETRWHNGQWEKYLKSQGWISA